MTLAMNPQSTISMSAIVLQVAGSALWSTYGVMSKNHLLTVSSLSSVVVHTTAMAIKLWRPARKVRILNDSADGLSQF